MTATRKMVHFSMIDFIASLVDCNSPLAQLPGHVIFCGPVQIPDITKTTSFADGKLRIRACLLALNRMQDS
jgi:hypothetical protein